MPNRIFEYNNFWLSEHPNSTNLYITWYDQGRRGVRRTSAHTADLEEAKQRLIEHAHEKQRPRDRSPEEIPILEVLNEYIERSLAGKKSQYKARGILGHLAEFFEIAGIDFVGDLTLDLQDRYIEWRRECLTILGFKGSNETIRRELGVLRSALNTYRKRGFINEVPYIRSLPYPPARQRYLTQEEFQKLLAECRQPHLRLFVLMGVHTMQRPGAILGLRCEQVDLSSNTIDFLPPGEAQTRKIKPVVPISQTLRPYIEMAVTNSYSGHVIELDGQPVRCVRSSFRKARERAGLDKDVTPYTLRHTGATLAAAAGVPLRQIAGMLGHTGTRTTELYAKHAPDFLLQTVDAMDALMKNNSPVSSLGISAIRAA